MEQPVDYVQHPIAVVSLACRLPDRCRNAEEFWRFIEQGRIAQNKPPQSRFDIKTHYDGSLRNRTMASPGGMYLQDVDPRDIDAQFFKLSRLEAIAMDPQQRQLLEVVYEGLENAGITLQDLDSKPVGCFVASFANDYGDIQSRDPEDRAAATVIGTGRAMLSNRISHFLNIKGPSMTIDTACSGGMQCLDVAVRYLHTREITGAIVAGSNMYMSPEWVMDHHMGASGTASATGKCHTFDAKADGYIKAEAVNMVYLKRLDDALRDHDPIRAIIRGCASNSDGWTSGIASPNSEAQEIAIRSAYRNAGISDLSRTGYIECHGTGTRAGDVLEVEGVASVFGKYHTVEKPLRIGSVKANIGHSEPASGISGLLKVVLSLEKGRIPGNPTFITPTPRLDFDSLHVRPSRRTTNWPIASGRRAGVNSFGYGGSNAHVVLDASHGLSKYATSYRDEAANIFEENTDEQATRPYILALSANDECSLKGQWAALDRYFSDLTVNVKPRDVAHTLYKKRTKHFMRGYSVLSSDVPNMTQLQEVSTRAEVPHIGFIFTGQGSQWPKMGKDLVENFPVALNTIRYLDTILQGLAQAPCWTLYDLLTRVEDPAYLRRPEISQPVCTALQLAITAILEAANVKPVTVVGHSSGEIAAAAAAGYITASQAIKIAYFRGLAVASTPATVPVGMLAIGIGRDRVHNYLCGSEAEVACFNSPSSCTISGTRKELEAVEAKAKDDGVFARMLHVDAAYHSHHMLRAAEIYWEALKMHLEHKPCASPQATMFSSTTGEVVETFGAEYWVQNLASPVLFDKALEGLLTHDVTVDCLLEIGPSNALSGPIGQLKAKLSRSDVEYVTAWRRQQHAHLAFLKACGTLHTWNHPINLAIINADFDPDPPLHLVDLPNYAWNHTTKYWHESLASRDWRFRKFVHHDLLGSKVLGTSWAQPTFKNVLKLSEVSWLQDHSVGGSVIFPAAGYVAMAIEALYQKVTALDQLQSPGKVTSLTYKLRNVSFDQALQLDTGERSSQIMLSLHADSNPSISWHEFKIYSISGDNVTHHCKGQISTVNMEQRTGSASELAAFMFTTPAAIWYRAFRDIGYEFGPSFQRLIAIESTAGKRENRASVSFECPETSRQHSVYSLHPACLDSCLQATAPSLWQGQRSTVGQMMLPALIDEITIFRQDTQPGHGIACANAEYIGIGNRSDAKRYMTNVNVFDALSGSMLVQVKGLRYHTIDSSRGRSVDHLYSRLEWNADVSFMNTKQLYEWLQSKDDASAVIAEIANLIAHRQPDSRIMEANFNDDRSLWLDEIYSKLSDIAIRCPLTLYSHEGYSYTSAQQAYGDRSVVRFGMEDLSELCTNAKETFDLLLVNYNVHLDAVQNVIDASRELLSIGGFLCLVASANEVPCHPEDYESITSTTDNKLHVFRRIQQQEPTILSSWAVKVISISSGYDPLMEKTIKALSDRGWMLEHLSSCHDAQLVANDTVLVLDEIFSPILSQMIAEQYAILQMIVASGCRLLWVTQGSQFRVTDPDRGLFFGLLRTLCAENRGSRYMALDLGDSDNEATATSLSKALQRLIETEFPEQLDHEFAEREGIIYTPRLLLDNAVNSTVAERVHGARAITLPFHEHPNRISLRTDRPGSVDSLYWAEELGINAAAADELEIRVEAASLNFKDVANALGVVAADEHMIGLEGAGYITQLTSSRAQDFKLGDRVVFLLRRGGAFTNLVRTTTGCVQRIPDWMSFEHAATLGVCFSTVLYGLDNLARVRKGQSVLIHSASGGVGLAALQLCRHFGCQVYVTCGSAAKREFLHTEYDVPYERIFSSRNVTFADELFKVTEGKGVDVVLNSTTGDMLSETWRCIADGGIFLEIGKKDILERKNLSMEPFGRCATYAALDLSHKAIDDEVGKQLLESTVQLATAKHISPIHICQIFGWDQIHAAFRFMRDGKHIGKVVISKSSNNSGELMLPVQPAAKSFLLRSDVSYLIAGGLKGVCGSLAIYMAKRNAKNLVVISRSGCQDTISKNVIFQCEALGAHVEIFTGDITKLDDVRNCFASVSKPIAGVIQGAMVLRDRLFENMTLDDFQEAIAPKVAGTWNLHTVAQEQSSRLDFFTMLSSVSGIAGQSGQANYNAGNVFQDSFSVYRTGLGLKSCSVNLGRIDGVGYLVEHGDISRRLESKGWPPINEATLQDIFEYSLIQQSDTPYNPKSTFQLISGLPYPLNNSTPMQPWSRFSPLGSTTDSGLQNENEDDANLTLLKTAVKEGQGDDKLLSTAATKCLNGVLMRSLGLANPLEASRPLTAYGIDSLVAVELRNWVRHELGLELGMLDITGAKTLASLGEELVRKLKK